MQIFYITTSNCLLINLYNQPCNKVKSQNNYTLLYNDEQLVAINIFNVDKNLNLSDGLIYPTDQVLQFIKTTTNLDLNPSNHFVVAEVTSCEDIPKTHLHKCVVSDGKNNYDIICGASNVRVKLKVVMAKVNTILPNGKEIKHRTLMGFASNGMLCSAKELQIAIDSIGILELDDSQILGTEFLPVYKNIF